MVEADRPRDRDRVQARVGIVDHVEDRIVGLKVRDIYEVPAAAILLEGTASREACLDDPPEQLKLRARGQVGLPQLRGPRHEPLRSDLDAYVESANEHVTGELTVRLYKGSAMVVGRSSPYALYDRALAGFGESGASSARTRAPASSSCSRPEPLAQGSGGRGAG